MFNLTPKANFFLIQLDVIEYILHKTDFMIIGLKLMSDSISNYTTIYYILYAQLLLLLLFILTTKQHILC